MNGLEKHYLDTIGLTSLWSKIKSLFVAKRDLSNYYTKPEVDGLLSYIGGVNSVYGGMSITAEESEGGDDAPGGLSFFNAVERTPGYDGTSQMNIAEDADTVEDE